MNLPEKKFCDQKMEGLEDSILCSGVIAQADAEKETGTEWP